MPKKRIRTPILGETNIVNESGMYKLILVAVNNTPERGMRVGQKNTPLINWREPNK